MAVPGEGPLTPLHWAGSSFSAHREDVQVDFQGRPYRGRLVTESGAPPRPLVIVIHNFQGLKLFDEQQTEYIARLGYAGLAIDTYGDAVPREKRPWPEKEEDVPAYMHMVFCEHFKTQHDAPRTRLLLQAWIDSGLAHPAVASSHLPVMIGYSYGGGCCLEAIRGGLKVAGAQAMFPVPCAGPEYLHNPGFTPDFLEKYGLVDLVAELKPNYKPPENNYNKTAVVLIETGLNDECVPVPMLTDAMKEFNDAGVDMVVSSYTDTSHGFALPPSTGPLAFLKERADRRSTEHLLRLCREVWPDVAQQYVPQNAVGTCILPPQEPV